MIHLVDVLGASPRAELPSFPQHAHRLFTSLSILIFISPWGLPPPKSSSHLLLHNFKIGVAQVPHFPPPICHLPQLAVGNLFVAMRFRRLHRAHRMEHYENPVPWTRFPAFAEWQPRPLREDPDYLEQQQIAYDHCRNVISSPAAAAVLVGPCFVRLHHGQAPAGLG